MTTDTLALDWLTSLTSYRAFRFKAPLGGWSVGWSPFVATYECEVLP